MSKKITVGKIEQLTDELPEDFGKEMRGVKGFPEVLTLEADLKKAKSDIHRLLEGLRNMEVDAHSGITFGNREETLLKIAKSAHQLRTELIERYPKAVPSPPKKIDKE